MNTISSVSTINSIFNSLEQLAQLCFDSVDVVTVSEELSVNGLKDLSSAKMQLLQMKKIIRSYNFISAPLCKQEDIQYESFCWSDFSQDIMSTVKAVFPSYRTPSFSFTNSFNTDETFLTNRRRFNIIVYNLIFVLIIPFKKDDDFQSTKLTFHLANGKDCFVLHIRNSKNILTCNQVDNFLSDDAECVPDIRFDKESIDSELAAAAKASRELGIKIKFSALKSGDKFEIFIPKTQDLPITTMKSPRTYSSDMDTAAEIFSEFA